MLVPLGGALALLPLPFLSPGVALLGGAAVGLSAGNPYISRTRAWARKLLSLSVIGLGAGMDLRVVARAGVDGLGTTFVSIAACLALGALLTRVLRLELRTGVLLSVGTAVCGGSAHRRHRPGHAGRRGGDRVALGTVFLLNAVALFLFPAIGARLSSEPACLRLLGRARHPRHQLGRRRGADVWRRKRSRSPPP